MKFYDEHETFPGVRGGLWHLHDRPADKRAAVPSAALRTQPPSVATVPAPVATEAVPTKATQADLF